jgi:hypothetical protein
VNVEEKVATLEALLARVQNNAAKPRILRPAGAAPPNGGAHLVAPDPAVVAPIAAAAKPVEKVAPARVEAVPPQDSIDMQLDNLLDMKAIEPVAAKVEKPPAAKIEKPVEAKVEKPVEAKIEKPVAAKIEKPVEAKIETPVEAKIVTPVEAKIEKPVEAKVEKPVEAKVEKPVDLLDVWAEALQDEVPRAQPAAPIVATKVDEGTPKPAPIAALSITPVATKPVAARPATPPARPIAPRPAFGSKPDVTPAPAAAKVVEKIEPAITAPKPVEKIAPIIAAPKPVEKVTPAIAAARPAEKIAAIVAPAKPAEKVADLKAADDEIRFDVEAAPLKKPEPRSAGKPVETAAVAAPTKAAPVAVEPPTLPVAPRKIDLDMEDDLVTNDDETMLMNGSIPEPEPHAISDETTSDEETIIALPKAGEISAKIEVDLSDDEPTTDAATTSDGDEATQVFQGRASRPEAATSAPVAAEADGVSAKKIDELKVVVSPAVRAPVTASPYSTTEETVRAVKITDAVPPPRPSDSGEATAPSRRYPKPESEELEALPMNGSKRASGLMLGLVAAALVGAGVFLGLRNGWFEGSSTKGVPTSPTTSGAAPSASTATITTAATAPIPPIAPAGTPTLTASAAPAASASAAPSPSVSAAPIVTASAAPTVAPTAAPVADGDGSALPPNRGYVIINSTKPASVFLTGNFAGATGTKLEVECGAKFLRLAAPSAERPATPDWTSDGRSISVACRSTTTVTFEASR